MKILFAGLIAVSAGLAQPVLTATAPIVRPGATVTVTVSLASASGAALQFFLPQIPGVLYAAVPGPAVPAGDALTCGASLTPAPVLFGCVVAGGVAPLVDGVLAIITFPAPPAGSYPLTVSQQVAADPSGAPVVVSAGPPLTLVVTTPCDVNGDGKADATDVALSIQGAIARLIAAALDLTGDGMVNVVDVQRVVNASKGGACRTGA